MTEKPKEEGGFDSKWKYGYVSTLIMSLFELAGVLLFLLVMYSTTLSMGSLSSDDENSFQIMYEQYFQFFINVTIFALIGFGFVSAYLKYHRWMSIGITLFIIAFTCQFYIFFSAFWNKCLLGSWEINSKMIVIGLKECLAAMKSTVAILVTLGALLGKVDILQVTFLVIFELFLYTLNEAILFYSVKVRDMGGCFSIFAFGSFFGLFASWIYSPKTNCKKNPNNKLCYSGSTLAFVGTFFIYIMFPSFNAVNPLMSTPFSQWNLTELSIQNTFIALTSSLVFAFISSYLFNLAKFDLFEIQNATYSAGIMIGACSDMFAYPYPPLLIGAFAGIFTTLGMRILPNALQRFSYYDTRKQFFIYGIASIFGMVASCIACSTLEGNYFGLQSAVVPYMLFGRKASVQASIQLAGFAISMGIGSGGGIATGKVFRVFRRYNFPEDTFGDHIWWCMPSESQAIASHNKNSSSIMQFSQSSMIVHPSEEKIFDKSNI